MRMSSGTVRRRRVLVVDPDAVYRAGLEEPLETVLWTVLPCAEADDALRVIAGIDVDALWTELDLREGEKHGAEGIDLLERVARAAPWIHRLVVTASIERPPLPAGVRWFSKRETSSAVRYLATLVMSPPAQRLAAR